MANRDGHGDSACAKAAVRPVPDPYPGPAGGCGHAGNLRTQGRCGQGTRADRGPYVAAIGPIRTAARSSWPTTPRPGSSSAQTTLRTVDLYRWLLRKHIKPYLGGVAIARLSTAMVREWRATLLQRGVSVSVTAKAYRLLRAVMMTAVEEDKILPRNPCQIRKAGKEDAAGRPVLTVAQVFALAEQVGRRPVGNIRATPGRLPATVPPRTGIPHGPRGLRQRAEAERALWTMAGDGRADCMQDRRFYALVLLATFSSLRWGEVTALRRRDLDLDARTVRIRAASSNGPLAKCSSARPSPGWSTHRRRSRGDRPGPARSSRRLRQGRARRARLPGCQRWSDQTGQLQQDVRLAARRRVDRHAGAALPRPTAHREPVRGAERCGTSRLMARMGHDSERAAMIYQHEARGADQAITNAIDAHVQGEQGKDDGDENGQAGLVPAG